MDNKRRKIYIPETNEDKSIEEVSEIINKSIKSILSRVGRGFSDSDILYNKKAGKMLVNGVDYKNIDEINKNFRVDLIQAHVNYKLSKGASLDEIVEEATTGKKPKYDNKPKSRCGVEINLEGVKYNSIMEAYNHYVELEDERVIDKTYNTIKQRVLEYKFSHEKSFFAKDLNKEKNKYKQEKKERKYNNGDPVVVYGKSFKGLKEAHEFHEVEVSLSTVYKRLDKGYSLEDALFNKPRKIKKGDIIMPDGNVFKGVTEACKFYKIVDQFVVNNRIRYGWGIVDAIITKNTRKKVVVNKITYKSLMDAYNKIGRVPFSTFQSRIRNGHEAHYCLGLDD